MDKIKDLFEEIKKKYGKLPIHKDADMTDALKEWNRVLGGFSKDHLDEALSMWYEYNPRKAPGQWDLKIKLKGKPVTKTTTFVCPVPAELKQDYLDAARWHKNMIKTRYWDSINETVLTPDIGYAFKMVLRVFTEANKEIIGEYSEDVRKASHALILTLFYKHTKDHDSEIKKYLVVYKFENGKMTRAVPDDS